MRRFYIMLPVLAALLLAGCGNNGQLDGAEGQGGEAALLQEGTPEADSAEYKREIAFDIDAISDPIVNDEIKASLKAALEGIVNEDLEQFNSAFTTPDLAKANEYGFKTGGGITFTGVDYISNQPEGRVVMNVNYNWITADGEERADSPNYWFMQSKEGKWGLVTID
ncbi:hypothetical protein [Paenibacillus sp. DMB5]|uniref:hypothetical protein n=1 Tax=Paenibacillus sp. DMB5 TaxID=1780103 RepID=UPI00076CA789|nr:hypothetical protein [Paenibacillus sp. DMB5]KUP24623.1 hypothetical protein AWJ19_20100 [Paenibacillus sp. DMB5]